MNNALPLKFSAAALLAMAAASAWALTVVPGDTQVAVHFNLEGAPDRFASPLFAFAIMPVAVLLLSLIFAVAPRFERRRDNLQRSGNAYATFWIGSLAILLVAHAVIIASALGMALSIPRGLTAVLGLFLMVTGNVASRIRPNGIMGVRTPWTRASDRIWAKTHRVFGWASVLLGLGLVALAVANAAPAIMVSAIVGGVVAISLGSIAYSYWAWRQEQAGA